MKKAFKIIAGIVGALIVLVVAIPFFVDVDKFRPQIVKAVNDNTNGTLELGKLSLSLFGKVHVTIDGMNLKDPKGRSVLSVKDAAFDVPFLSVLSGSPAVTLSMKEPRITVIKNKEGKLNVMSLMKDGAKTDSAAGQPAADKDGKVELPSMAVNAHIGISIVNAKLIYQDEVMSLSNTIDKFNLRIKDLSLSRTTELEMWADLKTQMGKGKDGTNVEGPLRLIASLKPEVADNKFKSATLNAIFTADDLDIQQGVLFHKKAGIPCNFKFDGTMTQESLNLKQAAAKFHNAEIVVAGTYHKTNGADITFNAKPIDLKPWSELVPMLKEFELEGKLGLDGGLKGPADKLQYNAKLTIQNLAAKGPMLKAKPVINGSITVVTDKVDYNIDLKGPGNELVLDGKLVSFTAPQITFALKSPKGMDLDQWIDFPKPAPGAAKDKKAEEAAAAKAPAADYDAMIEPLRSNPMMKAMVIDGGISLAFLKVMNARIDDIQAKLQMKNLVIGLTGLKMKMFGGNIAGAFTTDLKPKNPQYTMNLTVAGFDMDKAVESQFTAFKDTVSGKLATSISGGGSSFNAAEIKKNLQIKGDFKLTDAMFKSIDVAKMATEAVNKSITKIGEKVPGIGGKTVTVPGNADSKYEVMSSNFTMAGGFLEAPNFIAKAAQKRGIDIKGYTKMGLVDESLDAKWELIDSQKMLPPVNAAVAGKQINNVLAKGDNDPLILPIDVGCKWSQPCTNYSKVPEYLAGVAAGRVAKAAGDVAKSKAQEALQKAVGDKAPDVIKNGLKGLFGN
ncbi:MAG: AsmA family protein [Bdellovibrionales bacterium]|nr:AsmA family protein [Bdellovibrionales bacterium]